MIHLDTTEVQRVTKEMNKYLDGMTIEALLVLRRKKFYYKVILSESQCKQDVSALDLSPRAYHCLMRAGFHTIGCVLDHCQDTEGESSKRKLLQLRNLGKGTADEILFKLFLYQFSVLPDERRKRYMQTILAMNAL